MKNRKLYQLTDGDRAIFARAEATSNPNWITNYYLRSATSGTYWRPVPEEELKALKFSESRAAAKHWVDGYSTLHEVWRLLGQPGYFGPWPDDRGEWRGLKRAEFEQQRDQLARTYQVQGDAPVFFHPHGIQFLDWQLAMFRSRHPIQVVPGGYGCIAAGTRIFDAARSEHTPVEELARTGRAPAVLAWDGSRFVRTPASVPWIKGAADLYRVEMASGRAITVTMAHRFLASCGWLALSDLIPGMDIRSESGLDQIRSVEAVGAGAFYDLQVPGLENYLAEGLVHHNSSKTWGRALGMLVRAVTLPGYRGFALGPFSKQSGEVYKQLLRMIRGTYFERFLMGYRQQPNPLIVLGHSGVGETVIEGYPILENPESMRNLSGDEAMIDQAELLPDLDEILSIVGSRLRGTYQGREMVGQITLVANSDDNPQLWNVYDRAEDEPDYVWAHTAQTHENTHLTVRDLMRFEKDVGHTEDGRQRHLLGKRPIGSGEHFSAESLKKCRSASLADEMEAALAADRPGYRKEERRGAGILRWETPYEAGKVYCVAADPGWANAPARNSAVIGVWDITHFPEAPAIMRGFHWVDGLNSPLPWLSRYMELVTAYRAGVNGFDATGFQSGYERLTELAQFNPLPIQLTASKKLSYLNLAKKLVAEGMLQMPPISGLFYQLASYKLPDERLAQDTVMMLLVTAGLLEPLYWQALAAQLPEAEEAPDPDDRYARRETREIWHDGR